MEVDPQAVIDALSHRIAALSRELAVRDAALASLQERLADAGADGKS